jgi:hypothetical protein
MLRRLRFIVQLHFCQQRLLRLFSTVRPGRPRNDRSAELTIRSTACSTAAFFLRLIATARALTSPREEN